MRYHRHPFFYFMFQLIRTPHTLGFPWMCSEFPGLNLVMRFYKKSAVVFCVDTFFWTPFYMFYLVY